MRIVDAVILGVVQGLTEFLPVSSSAHLILARAMLGWDADAFGLAFDVACHVGTLLAVLTYFWRDLWDMARAVPRIFESQPPARLARLIVLGTVPVVIIGLLFASTLERTVRTPGATAVTLVLGAVALLAAERLGPRRRGMESLTSGEAVGLGCAQAAALVPGISRSGATIAAGMLLGLTRESAARFSFLLGVPAITAAAAKEGLELAKSGLPSTLVPVFLVGMATSAVVGYVTIAAFLRYLARHRLDVFAYYRLALAALVVVWLLAR